MTQEDNPEAAATTSVGAEPKVQLQKIYVKDSSFESPNSPQVFTQQEGKPTLSLNLNSSSNQVGEKAHEFVMKVSVEAKLSDSLVFLIELEQAGLFTVEDCEVEELKRLLSSRCPGMLYPYLREAISDLAGKGGFRELPLPFDFTDFSVKAQSAPASPN